MAALTGMTGFARMQGRAIDVRWAWEARSVNGKGLDVRMKLPPSLAGLETAIRKQFSTHFKRGNIQLTLTLEAQDASSDYAIDEALLDALAASAAARGEPVRLDQLLLVPGVVMPRGTARSEEAQDVLEQGVLGSVDEIAIKLKTARDTEGAALEPLLLAAVTRMEALISQADIRAADQTMTFKSVLEAKLADLLAQDISEDRLAQEAALLALKADVREELDRLKAHCEQARELVAKGSPVGRKLEFLSQEFNRETNTLCAKSADIELTRIGLELKSMTEQFREQAANVE